MDGGLAMCLLVTLGFGAFVIWGRTAAGRQVLRQTVGEPAMVSPRPAQKTNASPERSKSVGKPSAVPARSAVPKKPSIKAIAPRSSVAQSKRSGAGKEPSRSKKK